MQEPTFSSYSSHSVQSSSGLYSASTYIKVMFKVGAKMAKTKKENFFYTHRKTKNPRSKKFRYMGFMESFNI